MSTFEIQEPEHIRYVVTEPLEIKTVADLERRIAESCQEFQAKTGKFIDKIELNQFVIPDLIMFGDEAKEQEAQRVVKVSLIPARQTFKL